MNDPTKFAVVFISEETYSGTGSLFSKDGDRYWLTTSDEHGYDSTAREDWSVHAPYNVVLFDTREAAVKRASTLKASPWWCKPRAFEVVELRPVYRIDHYVRKETP